MFLRFNLVSNYHQDSLASHLVKLCSHTVGRGVWVGLVQQGLNGGEDGRHVVGGGPAVLEDVQADPAVRVHVRVEHFTYEPVKNISEN